MADINKIIDELLLELSVTYPFPNMKDKEQVLALMEICDDLGYGYIKPTLYELLSEAEDNKESGLFPGKFHLGGGYYSSKDGGEAEFKNDKGNLRPVTPEEKAKFDSKGGKAPSAEKPTAPTSKEPSSETPPAEKPKDAPAEAPAPLKKEPVVKSKVDVLKSKVEKWSEKEKEFFSKGQDKPGSETRRSFGQALKDKVKGARNAIVHGLKHEVHTFQTAAKAVGKVFSEPGGYRSLDKEEKKALVTVGIKVATTALTAAAFGGLAHGAIAFAKHVAMELVPHVVVETIAVGAGKASIFAGADGEDERLLGDFMDSFADNMENMEIPDELMMSIVDSYNQKKTSAEPQSEIIDLNELFSRFLNEEEGSGESKEFPGKFHLGGGYYSSKDGGAAEFKNDKGNLRPLTDKEKAELSNGGGETDGETPDTASMIDTATKELEAKEKETEKDLPKQNPDMVLNDPNANAKSKAMARAFKSQQTIDKNKQEDSGKGTVGEPNRLQPANEDAESKVQKFKGKKSGKEIQTIEFEDGGMMFGTVHRNTKMVDDIIDQVKATIPQEEWENIVFLGEGGATNDEGELEFNDEMKYAAPQFEKLGAGIDTWDGDDLDVHNDQSKLYKKQKEKTGLNDSQVKAGNWASMIGQGEGTDTMSPADYLDDEGREFIQNAAKEAGLPPISSFDNPTGEVPNEENPEGSGDRGTLFRLAFPEDNGDKETKINDIQVAFNEARDENIVEKRKELVAKGKIPIVIAGESHVELVDKMMRGGSDKKSETKNVEPEKIVDEMPKADSETFAKDGKALDGIKPEELQQFNTDISKVSKMIDDAKAKGEPAPNINLCDITIPGTNLYCDDNQGIPREEMPQFKGKAVEGSRAAGMETDKDGEVDTEPVFREMLKEKGIKVLQTEVPADKLKATQKDLVGEKVIGMMGALEKDPNHPKITAPIYVSRDGYVIDGHHRWAAIVAHNAKHPDNPIPMKTTVIDMDIKDAIPMANKFAEDMGIAAKKADAKDGELPTPEEPSKKEGGVIYPLGGGYYSDTEGGTAQYIKVESVVNKIFIEENIKFIHLLFEENITKETPSGKDVMVKTIDVKDQPEANKEVEKLNKDGIMSLDTMLGGIEDTAGNKSTKENVQQASIAIVKLVEDMANDPKNPHAESHKRVAELLQKMFNGEELTQEEKDFLYQFVRIAEPTSRKPNSAKLYIAKEPNNFKGAGKNKREKISVGGRAGNSPVYGAFREFMENAGLSQMATTTFGTKLTTANQTFVDEEGKTKLLKGKDGKQMASIEEDESGNVTSVVIGETKIVRLDENEPNITETEKKLRERNNRNMDEYAKAIKKGDLKFIDMDDGVSPDTPENRVIVIKGALSGMAKRLTELAKKSGVDDERIASIIAKLQAFSERDPNEDPQQWFIDLKEVMSLIANDEGDPSLKECWANYAEVYAAIVEMHDEGKGTENGACALLPESTTLETVDVITINTNGVGERKIVTLDGKSVKKGLGAASALTSKTEKSTYKNDPDGTKKAAIIELSKSHDDIFRMKLTEPMDGHVELHTNYRNSIKNKAKELGVSDEFIAGIEDSLKEPNAGWKAVNAAVEVIRSQREKAGQEIDDETMEKIRMRLESYYMYGHISHEAYNHNVDVQDFTNDSILSQASDRGGSELVRNRDIKIDSSDGVTILAYPRFEFSIGSWGNEGRSGNAGAGRLHNGPKRE